MKERRVVITGMGIVSPVGNGLDEAWNNVRDGVSGIGQIEDFDTSTFATRIGGTIKNFEVTDYLAPKDVRKTDPFIHYGVAASVDAIKHSGLEITAENGHRIGVAMGSGIGGIKTIEDNHNKFVKGGARRVSPFFIPGSIINMTSGYVSIYAAYHRAQCVDRHGLRDLGPLHRFRRTHDRARRCRRDARRRIGIRDIAAGDGRFLLSQGDVHSQR